MNNQKHDSYEQRLYWKKGTKYNSLYFVKTMKFLSLKLEWQCTHIFEHNS